jgi:hypothetical protein
VLTGLWWGNLRERDHLKELDKERNIKMCIQGVGWEHGFD